MALLRRHPLEEEGEEWQTGAAYADGMRRHPPLEQLGRRVPIDAAINLQQGVAFIVVLSQEQRRRPLPEFSRCLIEEAPKSWRKWDVLEKDKKKI